MGLNGAKIGWKIIHAAGKGMG